VGGGVIAGILNAEQVVAEDGAVAGGLIVKGAIAAITCERSQDM
jgi:hypothetical protein